MISEKEAVAILKTMKHPLQRGDGKSTTHLLQDIALNMAIKKLEQKLKTGYWINIEDRTDWYDTAYKCSCCGREIITPYELKNNLYSDYPYCHCGAKMVEPQERSEKE